MKDFINKNTISFYARTNETLLKMKPKAICLEFPGLGGDSCLGGKNELGTYDTEFAKECAQQGVVLAYVFTGPWSWMNKASVNISDAVVDALIEKYGICEIPLVVCGGSMGGLGALIYTAETRHKVSACVAACPCCDVPKQYDVIPEVPRSIVSALAGYEKCKLSQAMECVSPMHRIQDMPYIPYYISYCNADELFQEEITDKYVKQMIEKGHDVEYVKMPGMKHGEFTPDGIEKLRKFQLHYLLK